MVAKDGEECAFHFSSANISGVFLVCQAQSKSTRDVQMSEESLGLEHLQAQQRDRAAV